MDYSNARFFHAEKMFHLGRGEAGNGDDQVAALGCAAGLFGESGAKFGRGVVAGHHEQVVKRRHRAASLCVHALIQGMKNFGGRRAAQQAPRCILR